MLFLPIVAAALALTLSPQQHLRAAAAPGVARHAQPLALAAKSKKPAKKAAPAKAGGFGKKAEGAAVAAPTAAELLKKSMDMYDEIKRDQRMVRSSSDSSSDDDADVSADSSSTSEESTFTVTEYVVTVKVVDDVSEAADAFGDWVPVCILNLKSSNTADTRQLVPQAIGASVKEIIEAGCQSASLLRKAPRTSLQYAFEPMDSYNTHVFEGLFSRGDRKAKALQELGVVSGASPADIKKEYRKFMMTLHPDRHIGDAAGAAAASEQMLRVQNAYEELGGGKGGASQGYAKIGGKNRVDFSGSVNREALGPLGKKRPEQEVAVELEGWRCGVFPLEPDVCREFTLRNVMALK